MIQAELASAREGLEIEREKGIQLMGCLIWVTYVITYLIGDLTKIVTVTLIVQ